MQTTTHADTVTIKITPNDKGNPPGKLADVEQKIQQLEAIRRALNVLLRSCRKRQAPRCPMLEALDDPGG